MNWDARKTEKNMRKNLELTRKKKSYKNAQKMQ